MKITYKLLGNCPILTDDIYFVGNPVDFNYIGNCTRLNSSLFITGDYNIYDLTSLRNIETIEGYLVILDSHLIRNLRGLQNLHEVKGNELYLKTAGITFKYNLTHISTGDVFRENMKNNTELGKLAKSYILKDVMGSDHAPVAIEIND